MAYFSVSALSEYRCTLTPLLFVWKRKFVLKMMVNAWGNKRILSRSLDCSLFCCKGRRKPLEHLRRRGKHSTTSRVSPYTSFVLKPLPTCFTTEQRTVKAYLFVKLTKLSWLEIISNTWMGFLITYKVKCKRGRKRLNKN